MVRGTLDHDNRGWRIKVYDTKPLRHTIVEVDSLPTWADASDKLTRALRLIG